MVNDPIGDLLAQIKNASMARKRTINLPYSKMKEAVVKILVSEGYLTGFEVKGEIPKKTLTLTLGYASDMPVVTDVKRISKPGLRWYVNKGEIPTVVGGMGIAILSTSSGIMTGREARQRGLGGEVLCEIW